MAATSNIETKSPSTLKVRRDFLAAAKAFRASSNSMVVQARPRHVEERHFGPRVGYTCSKKVGNAVARNRAKRRLRAAVRDVLREQAREDWDYVLIGRAEKTASRPYQRMLDDLRDCLGRVHRAGDR